MNEDPCGTAAITLPTVTTVADPSAGRTHPILGEEGQQKCPVTKRLQEDKVLVKPGSLGLPSYL